MYNRNTYQGISHKTRLLIVFCDEDMAGLKTILILWIMYCDDRHFHKNEGKMKVRLYFFFYPIRTCIPAKVRSTYFQIYCFTLAEVIYITKFALLIQYQFPDIMTNPPQVSLEKKTITVRHRSTFYRNVWCSVVKTTHAEKFLLYESFARVLWAARWCHTACIKLASFFIYQVLRRTKKMTLIK
jgi:hypothetical protein